MSRPTRMNRGPRPSRLHRRSAAFVHRSISVTSVSLRICMCFLSYFAPNSPGATRFHGTYAPLGRIGARCFACTGPVYKEHFFTGKKGKANLSILLNYCYCCCYCFHNVYPLLYPFTRVLPV